MDQGTISHQTGVVREEYRKAFRQIPSGIYRQSDSYRILDTLINTGRVHYKAIRVIEDIAEICDELESVVDDNDDRKFVAVALAFAQPPPIVNATDPGWKRWEGALADHGVNVCQLCPELFDSSEN